MRWWVLGSLALVLGWACGGENDDGPEACPAGSERCACYGNGTCDGALECFSNLCVAPSGGSGSGGAVEAGAAGAESEPSAGGDAGAGGVIAPGGSSKGGTSTAGGTSNAGGGSGSAGTDAVSGGDGGNAPTEPVGVGGAAGSGELGDAGEGGAPRPGGSGGSGGTGANAEGGAPPSMGGSAQGGEAGSSSGAVLFSDDFEDGTADGWSAPSWIVFSDGGNRVLRQNPEHADATTPAHAGSSDWGDRRMEVSFKFTQEGSFGYAALGTEIESVDDRAQLMVNLDGEGTLLHAAGGALSTKTFDAEIELGTWYRFALEIEGTTLRGYLDGTEVVTLEAGTAVPGGIALTGLQTGDVYYDDVLVTLP